jgi:hypothetical protein
LNRSGHIARRLWYVGRFDRAGIAPCRTSVRHVACAHAIPIRRPR